MALHARARPSPRASHFQETGTDSHRRPRSVRRSSSDDTRFLDERLPGPHSRWTPRWSTGGIEGSSQGTRPPRSRTGIAFACSSTQTGTRVHTRHVVAVPCWPWLAPLWAASGELQLGRRPRRPLRCRLRLVRRPAGVHVPPPRRRRRGARSSPRGQPHVRGHGQRPPSHASTGSLLGATVPPTLRRAAPHTTGRAHPSATLQTLSDRNAARSRPMNRLLPDLTV